MAALESTQDITQRLMDEVAADLAEGHQAGREAAAAAVTGPGVAVLVTGVREWLTGPVTPAFEGRARVIALVACGLPVLVMVVALILAS